MKPITIIDDKLKTELLSFLYEDEMLPILRSEQTKMNKDKRTADDYNRYAKYRVQ